MLRIWAAMPSSAVAIGAQSRNIEAGYGRPMSDWFEVIAAAVRAGGGGPDGPGPPGPVAPDVIVPASRTHCGWPGALTGCRAEATMLRRPQLAGGRHAPS